MSYELCPPEISLLFQTMRENISKMNKWYQKHNNTILYVYYLFTFEVLCTSSSMTHNESKKMNISEYLRNGKVWDKCTFFLYSESAIVSNSSMKNWILHLKK